MDPKDFFKNDCFAKAADIKLLEIGKGYGKTSLVISEKHLNAGGVAQGGVLFTLADLALAAAANSHGTLALSLSSNITFLRSSKKGDVLYAEAHERYQGRTTGYYQVDITNQHGELVATFESSVFRKQEELPFSL
ncbi:MAG: PaaI family thioesterase [Bacteroides sp.]|jgi:acyl-CoA thioesterase|nr:PaaI family thioesterase [Bacteroides sp.]MCI1683915.1 PaaI family thioesterase [Bacteroides sp.]